MYYRTNDLVKIQRYPSSDDDRYTISLPDSEEDYRNSIINNQEYHNKNIVFIETNIQLNSASGFSQLIFKTKRLITMISENHTETWKCPNPSINIAEYVKNCIVRNPKSKVLLEYNTKHDPSLIGSHSIQEIYNLLKKYNKTTSIIPYDTRSFFLGDRGQMELYHYGIENYTKYEIFSNFIEPYFLKLQENPNLLSLYGDYDPDIGYYLVNTYVPDIENTFRIIVTYLDTYPVEEIRKMLKDAWLKIADYFVLKYLLKNDDINEYIIIQGYMHQQNLNNVLKYFMTDMVQTQTGNPDKCVNLYKTYQFN